MKNGILAFLLIQAFALKAQIPESNLVFKLDYNESFMVNIGETSSYTYQGGFLSEDRYGIENNSCIFEADKQIVVFDEFPCFDKEITISLWLKYESFQSDRYPIIQLSNNDEFVYGETKHLGFEVHNDRTSLSYYNQVGGKIVADQDSLTYDGNWHHLLGTISDLNLLKFYIDNEYIGFKEFNNNTFEGINQIIIGGGYDGLFGNINIDDIRIYNRTLERCEIEALFYEKDSIINCEIIEETECNRTVSYIDSELQNSKIYPNPNNTGILNIESHKNGNYKLLNPRGQTVKKGINDNGQIVIRDLSSGIYFLLIDNLYYKLMIQ